MSTVSEMVMFAARRAEGYSETDSSHDEEIKRRLRLDEYENTSVCPIRCCEQRKSMIR